jgi:hypothetical protein
MSLVHPYSEHAPMITSEQAPRSTSETLLLVGSWLAVGVPLAWGIAMTLKKAMQLFQ